MTAVPLRPRMRLTFRPVVDEYVCGACEGATGLKTTRKSSTYFPWIVSLSLVCKCRAGALRHVIVAAKVIQRIEVIDHGTLLSRMARTDGTVGDLLSCTVVPLLLQSSGPEHRYRAIPRLHTCSPSAPPMPHVIAPSSYALQWPLAGVSFTLPIVSSLQASLESVRMRYRALGLNHAHRYPRHCESSIAFTTTGSGQAAKEEGQWKGESKLVR